MIRQDSKNALKRIVKHVKSNKSWAQVMLAEMYRDGMMVKRSFEKSIELFQLAADQNDLYGIYGLGRAFSTGRGCNIDYKRAYRLFKSGAEQNHLLSMCALGELHINILKDYDAGRHWLQMAANAGCEQANKGLAVLDEIQGTNNSTSKSKSKHSRNSTIDSANSANSANSAVSCSCCGALKTSNGPQFLTCNCGSAHYCKNKKCQKRHWKDHKKEHRLSLSLKKTASATSTESTPQQPEAGDECPICLELLATNDVRVARMVCCGKGGHVKCRDRLRNTNSGHSSMKLKCPLCQQLGPETQKKHIKLLRNWVKKKKVWASSELGAYYLQGIMGVKKSYTKAIELLTHGATGGNAIALFTLGQIYRDGIEGVVASDPIRATKLLEIAANQKNPLIHVMNALAGMYYQGCGMEEKNLSLALKYWTKGHDMGCESSSNGLKMLKKDKKNEVKNVKLCGLCYEVETKAIKLFSCGKCHKIWYCNREHQVKHWKNGHKKVCGQ